MTSVPPSLEDYIILRGKSLWKKRYAKVANHIFSFKKDKSKCCNITWI